MVADRDGTTGKTRLRQILEDEEGNVHGLAGAAGVACSSDGMNVYVAAGRFRGDHAVSAYRFGANGRLELVQEFQNFKEGFSGFEGGNCVTVSPDGLNVYASATLSGTVASFRARPSDGQACLPRSRSRRRRQLP